MNKEDKICYAVLCILALSGVGCAMYMEDKIGLIFPTFVLSAYCVATMILNWLLSYFPRKIKLPIPKKYAKKKSPIYKLDFSHWGHYRIQKWELKYVSFETMGGYMFFVPFCSLFSSYRYTITKTLGQYLEEEIGGIEDLETEFERRQQEKKRAISIQQHKIKTLNSEYDENYI